MFRLEFRCTLKSDIIMTATGKTSGQSDSLDYIPGAKFMGIVANKLYNSHRNKQVTNDEVLDIIHRGKVYFGDAHPCINGKRTLHVPAAWFFEKGKEKGTEKDGEEQYPVYVHHGLVGTALEKKLLKEGTQIKQFRAGYFTMNDKSIELVKVSKHFSLKSAHDRKQRRSKEGQMYGYFSLPKDSEWSFFLESENKDYLIKVRTILEGKKRIGKSKSAEFGLVDIRAIDNEPQDIRTEGDLKNEIILYAESNLCFYDKNGRPKLTLDIGDFNLKGKVLFEKSQIRTRIYQSWNGKRFNRDADRYIIQKGSVICLELTGSIQRGFLEKGVGYHKSEGFGKVMINPVFIPNQEKLPKDIQFKTKGVEIDTVVIPRVSTKTKDHPLLQFLKRKEKLFLFEDRIDKKVNEFKRENKDIFERVSNSQWGMLRNYAKNARNSSHFYDLAFHETSGFLHKGKSQKEWRTRDRAKVLEKYLFKENPTKDDLQEDSIIEFMVKLSSEMAKQEKPKMPTN